MLFAEERASTGWANVVDPFVPVRVLDCLNLLAWGEGVLDILLLYPAIFDGPSRPACFYFLLITISYFFESNLIPLNWIITSFSSCRLYFSYIFFLSPPMVITGFTRIWKISRVYWLNSVKRLRTCGFLDRVREAGAINDPAALGEGWFTD